MSLDIADENNLSADDFELYHLLVTIRDAYYKFNKYIDN
jgi:hypothetical protein